MGVPFLWPFFLSRPLFPKEDIKLLGICFYAMLKAVFVPNWKPFAIIFHEYILLYDQFKRLPQDISEAWPQWLKLTYHPSIITNNVSKNWSMTLKGLRGVVLRALIEKTPNFWPIEPIELKFWHLILIMECLKISLRGSHGSTFGPLWWP